MDPQFIIPNVKNVRQHKHYTGANIDMVVQMLKQQKPLPMLEFSDSAYQVCKEVNQEIQDYSQVTCSTLKKRYVKQFLPRLMLQTQKSFCKDELGSSTVGCGSIVPSPNNKKDKSKSIIFPIGGSILQQNHNFSPAGSLKKKDTLLLRENGLNGQAYQQQTTATGTNHNTQNQEQINGLMHINTMNTTNHNTEIISQISEVNGDAKQVVNQYSRTNSPRKVDHQNQKLEKLLSTLSIYEYSEIGWEGTADELALFLLIGGCQCAGMEEKMPLLDEKISKIGLSFNSHKSLKSVFQILYIGSDLEKQVEMDREKKLLMRKQSSTIDNINTDNSPSKLTSNIIED
eukprot:403335044